MKVIVTEADPTVERESKPAPKLTPCPGCGALPVGSGLEHGRDCPEFAALVFETRLTRRLEAMRADGPIALDDDGHARVALVLAWDGQPVAEGMDRMIRAAVAAGVPHMGLLAVYPMTGPNSPPSDAMVIEGFGTVILLDTDGREVSA